MTAGRPQARLKPGREKSLLRRHPWVFTGAVDSIRGDPDEGETVEVVSAAGEFLGWGAFSSASQIRLRIWSFRRDQPVDADFFRDRLQRAVRLRDAIGIQNQTDAYRLVHAESDGLPGLIVDRYADTLVVQLLSSGPERHREWIADLLLELTGASAVFERSDVDVRRLENLPERCGPLRGMPPPERLAICENGLQFLVNIRSGHKTGHYLDQRANRLRLRTLAQGRKTLDCFSYTGGFSLNAVAGGAAAVTALDSSGPALASIRENLEINRLDPTRLEVIEADVFQTLRLFRDQGRKFDLIVLDPPKFAPTSAFAEKAARGYKDINLLAFKLLNPGGLLFTFSCSGGITPDLFTKIVAGAALDAGVNAGIIDRLSQPADHPTALSFPEGAYLKGLVIAVA